MRLLGLNVFAACRKFGTPFPSGLAREKGGGCCQLAPGILRQFRVRLGERDRPTDRFPEKVATARARRNFLFPRHFRPAAAAPVVETHMAVWEIRRSNRGPFGFNPMTRQVLPRTQIGKGGI